MIKLMLLPIAEVMISIFVFVLRNIILPVTASYTLQSNLVAEQTKKVVTGSISELGDHKMLVRSYSCFLEIGRYLRNI